MKAPLPFILCTLLFCSMIRAEEDSVFEDLLRSPDLTLEKKEKISLKARVKNIMRGSAYLSAWGVSAAALVYFERAIRDLRGAPEAADLYRKQFYAEYPNPSPENRYEIESRTYTKKVAGRVGPYLFLALAAGVIYFNMKYRIQAAAYESLKKACEF